MFPGYAAAAYATLCRRSAGGGWREERAHVCVPWRGCGYKAVEDFGRALPRRWARRDAPTGSRVACLMFWALKALKVAAREPWKAGGKAKPTACYRPWTWRTAGTAVSETPFFSQAHAGVSPQNPEAFPKPTTIFTQHQVPVRVNIQSEHSLSSFNKAYFPFCSHYLASHFLLYSLFVFFVFRRLSADHHHQIPKPWPKNVKCHFPLNFPDLERL